MSEAYLGLGSNEGKRAKNLESALRGLEKDVLVLAVSPVYITKAWGLENQRNFYNQIAKIETSKKPHEVLDLLLHTERLLGRNRTIKWGPRCIDLDLLFYEDAILNDSLPLVSNKYNKSHDAHGNNVTQLSGR